MEDNAIGSALTQSQVSNYDEKANRCYVELTVQSADLAAKRPVMERFLFDGQTKELLATAHKENDSGIVFKHAGILGYDNVSGYIDQKMEDPSQ
jgi:hypothetical protein